MNLGSCANCLLHGWNQPDDLTTLQRCKRCKLIEYCDRDCQTEHWLNVHHKHCKYFADPVKAQRWDHKEEECVLCRQTAVIGKSRIRLLDNPNYECIFEDLKKFPSYHPHPFPVTGEQGDTLEKTIIVLIQLLIKFRLTQPEVVLSCQEDFVEVISQLKVTRLFFWRFRKIAPRSHTQIFTIPPIDLSHTINVKKVESGLLRGDPFKLWNIIRMVNEILVNVYLCRKLAMMINPLAEMPAEFRAVVSQGVNNSAKFLSTVNQVLDALATRVIPYRDVLVIFCGGSLQKTCSFCMEKIVIADFDVNYLKGPAARFVCLSTEIYSCNKRNCLDKLTSLREDDHRFELAIHTATQERQFARCDFCFALPPSAEVHRCSRCFSVMYCSTNCRDQDWNIHKKICKEGMEERKKKGGRSARRKEAGDALEEVEKRVENANLRDACDVVGKFRLKNSKRKSEN